jgi:hypothetical protein
MGTAALAHIPSKGIRNPPQAIVDPTFDPDSLGDPGPATGVEDISGSYAGSEESNIDALDGSEPVTTNTDRFGVYRVYTRKPLYHDPVQSRSPNTLAHGDAGTSRNQGLPHPEMQTIPYFYPFSNPSAAAMMVAHHSGTPVQSVQQTTQITRILGSLGSDLDPLDLMQRPMKVMRSIHSIELDAMT